MRSAILILSLVGVVVSEAPYHLPRPASQAPAFNYQAPVPVLRPQPPPIQQHHIHHQPAPQPNYVQSGYHYQQPSIQLPYVQPQPQPQYQQPQVQYQVPLPRYQPLPQPSPAYYAPAPAPIPAPIPAPAPAPQPIPQTINYPSTSYGVPQAQFLSRPVVQQPVVNYIQPQAQPAPAPINYYQTQQYSQGYSQPIQASGNLALQSQAQNTGFGSSSLSSYQADSNLYSGAHAQTHSEALDSLVVNHVQNIIKDNEHSTAKAAGYLSLVSGVSLENVKPSVEISSFVQSAPATSFEQSSSSVSSSSSSGSAAVAISAPAPSNDYGLPTITANSQTSQSILPSTKITNSYGVPN